MLHLTWSQTKYQDGDPSAFKAKLENLELTVFRTVGDCDVGPAWKLAAPLWDDAEWLCNASTNSYHTALEHAEQLLRQKMARLMRSIGGTTAH